MLTSLSHILVFEFHSFTSIYFISSLQTKLSINSSLFRPNQLSFESRIEFGKTGIYLNFLVEIQI